MSNQKLKEILSIVLFFTGITPLVLLYRIWLKKEILVLLYHEVRDPRGVFEPVVSPERFDQQLWFVRKFFNVIPARRLPAILSGEEPLPRAAACITFDDGFKNNYLTAYPLLKKYNLPAVIFLTTGSMDNKRPMWTSQVESWFRSTQAEELALRTLDSGKIFKMNSSAQRQKVCFEIEKRMKEVPDPERDAIFHELREKIGSVNREEECSIHSEMMDWQEVKTMTREGLVEFGSHTVSHRMLARLTEPEVRHELQESKKQIEKETGIPITLLSYPGNSYNAQVAALAQQTGYAAAFSVDHDWTHLKENLYTLKRVRIENSSIFVFLAEICLLIPKIRSLKDKILGNGAEK